MTNPVSPCEFIASLCAQNGCNDARGARDANNLDTDIRTAFTNGLCFLNELLQNAKDQSRDNHHVTFSFQGGELIFFHEGKPFNREDVQRICEYKAACSGEKSADRNQTGYKDIGFKSVFKVASRVDIWSQEWHFHFDENSDKWKAGNYPWQQFEMK